MECSCPPLTHKTCQNVGKECKVKSDVVGKKCSLKTIALMIELLSPTMVIKNASPRRHK